MSKLFGGTQKQRPPPEEPVAPIPDDEVERINQERKSQRRYGGRGRSGTVLTGGTQLG